MQARFAVPTCRLRAPRGLMGVLNEVGREGGGSPSPSFQSHVLGISRTITTFTRYFRIVLKDNPQRMASGSDMNGDREQSAIRKSPAKVSRALLEHPPSHPVVYERPRSPRGPDVVSYNSRPL